jgi:hypothetical protein
MRLTLIAVVVLFAGTSVAAQSSVTLTASVSETVALSVAPNFSSDNMQVVSSSGNTVQITLSGTDAKSSVIRVPLLVRSNSAFIISARFESQTAELEQLMVTDAHATGNLVAPQLVNSLDNRRDFDGDTARPWLVLSGPRISRGGTLASPNNALKVTLLIHLKPQTVSGWMVHLTLVGSAGSLTQ